MHYKRYIVKTCDYKQRFMGNNNGGKNTRSLSDVNYKLKRVISLTGCVEKL